jgi:hypothetical protein
VCDLLDLDPELLVSRGSDSAAVGASFGTTADYLQVLVPLINEGKGANGAQILRPETVKEMFRDQIEHLPGALDVNFPGVRDELSRDVQIMPGVNKGWVSVPTVYCTPPPLTCPFFEFLLLLLGSSSDSF